MQNIIPHCRIPRFRGRPPASSAPPAGVGNPDLTESQMDLNFTPEEEAFRQEVRAFIRDNLPEATRRHMEQFRVATRDMIVEWAQIGRAHV